MYTFGPTFRAENSNTSRHLAEFWVSHPHLCLLSFVSSYLFLLIFSRLVLILFLMMWEPHFCFIQDDWTRTSICWSKRWHGVRNCVSPVCSMLLFTSAVNSTSWVDCILACRCRHWISWVYHFGWKRFILFYLWKVRYILDNCKEDMDFFNTWIEKGIIDRLSVWALSVTYLS